MPSKSDHIKLKPEQDRRRKLTDEQKEEIRKIYATGTCGMRPLAKQFEVSRTTIQLIVNPERAEKVKQRIKERWRDYVPDKKTRNMIMRKHRAYKRKLYREGELKED